MAGSSASRVVQIIYQAIDQVTGPTSRMAAATKNFANAHTNATSVLGKSTSALNTHIGSLAKLGISLKLVEHGMNAFRGATQRVNAVLQGIGVGVGIGSFYALERAIGSVVGIIPNLIGKGEDWLHKVDQISDATGLSAEQASRWAGIVAITGGDVDRFSNTLGRMGKAVTDNEKQFARFGVATRDMNGNLLPTEALLENIMNRFNELGPSSVKSAGLLDLMSRAGLDLADVMGLTGDQANALTQQLYRMGLIVSDTQAAAGEALARTRNMLDLSIQGIGTQLTIALAPALTSLINGISNLITNNLQKIVTFAYQAVSFVIGLIRGFLGIYGDFTNPAATSITAGPAAGGRIPNPPPAAQTTAKNRQRASGEDAVTQSINRQIAAIDKQIDALEQRQRIFDAAREKERLLADINELQAQLDDLKTKGIFAAGMTHLEEELARQKNAADIVDTEKQIAQARQKLRDFEFKQAIDAQRRLLEAQRKALEDQLRRHRDAIRKAAGSISDAFKPLHHDFQTLFKDGPADFGFNMTDAIKKASAQAQQAGIDIATSIREALFGKDIIGFKPGGLGGTETPAYVEHQKGLIETMQELINTIGNFVNTYLIPLMKTLFPPKPPGGAPQGDTGAALSALLKGDFGPIKNLIFGTPSAPDPIIGFIQKFMSGSALNGPPAGPGTGAGPDYIGDIMRVAPYVIPEVLSAAGGLFSRLIPTGGAGAGLGGPFGSVNLLSPLTRAMGPTGALYRAIDTLQDPLRQTSDASQSTATKVMNGVNVFNPNFPTITSNTGTTSSGVGKVTDTLGGTLAVDNTHFGNIDTNTLPIPGIRSMTGSLPTIKDNSDVLPGVRAMTGNLPGIKNGTDNLPGVRAMTGATATRLVSTKTAAQWLATINGAMNQISSNTSGSFFGSGVGTYAHRLDYGFSNLYPGRGFAGGGVGLTPMGGMTALMGEAGKEAVAIIRNPRPIYGEGSGGPGPTLDADRDIHVHVYLDGRQIEEIITKRQRRGRISTTYRSNG